MRWQLIAWGGFLGVWGVLVLLGLWLDTRDIHPPGVVYVLVMAGGGLMCLAAWRAVEWAYRRSRRHA
ncbi:hypothetical protein VV02_03130 [Luteipulveratus mongoliensis]|uniref:Integral membrane protein n=1 Tax=Luteipulveratus mongoliensis TaxID=571913 RepID=A0A0K1JER4_9MICO|nr:hypothetical protein VV02_03130 [Luteipulveratus mongoliensis]